MHACVYMHVLAWKRRRRQAQGGEERKAGLPVSTRPGRTVCPVISGSQILETGPPGFVWALACDKLCDLG